MKNMYNIDIFAEVWKPIVNEPKMRNNYEVSSTGKVRNTKTNYVLGQSTAQNGYRRITVNDARTPKKKNTHLSVHRLVAKAFVKNECPKLFDVVNHLDGDRTNNNYLNLEWTDDPGNQRHAYDTGLRPRGEEQPNAIVNNFQVAMICDALATGYKRKEIINYIVDEMKLTNKQAKYLIDDILCEKSWMFISKNFDLKNRKDRDPGSTTIYDYLRYKYYYCIDIYTE